MLWAPLQNWGFFLSFFFFYCYSITVVCLFSPSLHPTPAEPTSLPPLHPPPWFCPCVLYLGILSLAALAPLVLRPETLAGLVALDSQLLCPQLREGAGPHLGSPPWAAAWKLIQGSEMESCQVSLHLFSASQGSCSFVAWYPTFWRIVLSYLSSGFSVVSSRGVDPVSVIHFGWKRVILSMS